MSDRRPCYLYQSDRPIPYLEAWQWQKDLMRARIQDSELPDVLLLVEHPPVYTLGQGSSLEFIKFALDDPAIECHRIERGGEVTYHAPGQIVAYPILNLTAYQRDLHWYLRQLEQVIIHVLEQYNLSGTRIEGLTGVWVDGKKIAQVGIKVSRWVTMHGFALNVNLDLAGFERIVPCGIRDRRCCSLAQFIPDVELPKVRNQITAAFAEVFGVDFLQRSLSRSEHLL
jgi:lipoyl(octanoyl) transferase